MVYQPLVSTDSRLPAIIVGHLPRLFIDAGDQACRRFIEFFTANIRNRNTREAYARAVLRFADWCERHKLRLEQLSPPLVAAYIEEISATHSAPTVKQHLAAVRMLLDYLVVGQVLPLNPASSVRGPRHVVTRGKTPVLSADQARQLLDAIDTSTIAGIRDRALIAVMVYSFARVSAVTGMNGDDYYPDGKRWWFRLHEKGGKFHEVPAHHKAEEYVDAYLEAAGIVFGKWEPLFRTVDRRKQLTDRRISRREVLAMVKRRARNAGLPDRIGCHSWRATGITTYLLGGGTLERAQQIAAHSSAKTTKLYDRRNDEITLDEIERIVI
jgi:integrase/recombinase XerD